MNPTVSSEPSGAFQGEPHDVGMQQGLLYRPFRDSVLEQMRPLWETTFPSMGISRSECEAAYVRVMEKWAPHWIPECEGMAKGLEMPADELLFLQSIRGVVRWGASSPCNCTSWVVLPEAATDGRMMLHKNRDGGTAWQGWLSKHVDGTRRWMGMVDLIATGATSGINDAGVAAIVNNGEPCDENNRFGFGTPSIVRVLLERAANAEEASDICLEIIHGGDYAHGNTGSIFMIADARHAFVIENTAKRAVRAEVPSGFEVRSNDWTLPGMKAAGTGLLPPKRISALTRRERAVEFLRAQRANGGIDVCSIRALSRDRRNAGDPMAGVPIANDRTSFGVTMTLDPERPDVFSEMSLLLGPPPCACSIRFAFGVSAIPGFVADSRMTQRAFAVRDDTGMEGDHVAKLVAREAELDVRYEQDLTVAREAFRRGEKAEGTRIMDRSLHQIAHDAVLG